MRSQQIERVLFDLDGTLFDTQIFHARAEVALMAEYGVIKTPEEVSAEFSGRPTEKVFEEVLGCSKELALKLSRRKWKKIFPQASAAKQLCDVRGLFLTLIGRGIRISIGTASPSKWARLLLAKHDLESCIQSDAVVGGDMVTNGKPSPEIWMRARCYTRPENCFVVEDGFAGIEAAISVGMPRGLLLPRQHEHAYKFRSAADILHFV